MDANPPGSGESARRRAIANVTPDASVLWIRIDGHTPRPIYLAGDPAEILAELENPVAY